MRKHWRPTKAQAREFAKSMQNEEYAKAYYERKEARAEKRRASSAYSYDSAGGEYVPTKTQSDFAWEMVQWMLITEEEKEAANMVMTAFACGMKVDHDCIHIINERRRKNEQR